jgi:hypothetical protein
MPNRQLPQAKVDQISSKPSAEEKKSGLENNKECVSVHAWVL